MADLTVTTDLVECPILLARIGNTPLVRLQSPNQGVQILGKAEWFNPGGSVKDRAARAIFESAIAQGLLTRDKTLIDATSGNTGIAYAMVCAALGDRAELVMPANGSGMASALQPGIYDAQLPDRHLAIDADAALRAVHDVARKEGLFVGMSAGAAIAAARQLARETEKGIIVTILPDSGDRYLNTPVWS